MMTLLRPGRVGIIALALVLIGLDPREASAQLVATTFEELQKLVKRGDTLDVTEASGRKTKGRLGELSPSSLELLVRKTGPDGREAFVPQVRQSELDVMQILLEHRDSLWNGVLIGAAVGAGPWLLTGALAAASGSGSCGSDSNVCPYVALFTGPIGTGIGALIDASIKRRTTVYYRASGQQSHMQVSPLLSKSVAGVVVVMQF